MIPYVIYYDAYSGKYSYSSCKADDIRDSISRPNAVALVFSEEDAQSIVRTYNNNI